jgi:ketosteroid isomerase-like protein
MRTVMADDAVSVARHAYAAFASMDRSVMEGLIGDQFRFTSALDNRIDRSTYFERCWPNSKAISAFDLVNLVQDGNRAFVSYEATSTNGQRFRNTEILTVEDGKIIEAEVYFGWTLPHRAEEGGCVAR